MARRAETMQVQDVEKVREGADSFERASVYTENHPDQIHVCVKQTKAELQELEPSECVVVRSTGELGRAKSRVGELIVDTGNCAVVKILFRHLELGDVDIVHHCDVSFDRCPLDVRCTQGILFCCVGCREPLAFYVLEVLVIDDVFRSLDMSQRSNRVSNKLLGVEFVLFEGLPKVVCVRESIGLAPVLADLGE